MVMATINSTIERPAWALRVPIVDTIASAAQGGDHQRGPDYAALGVGAVQVERAVARNRRVVARRPGGRRKRLRLALPGNRDGVGLRCAVETDAGARAEQRTDVGAAQGFARAEHHLLDELQVDSGARSRVR